MKYIDLSFGEFIERLASADAVPGGGGAAAAAGALGAALGSMVANLTVNKKNTHAAQVYEHYGYKTVEWVESDIGNGYVMDDFVMVKLV